VELEPDQLGDGGVWAASIRPGAVGCSPIAAAATSTSSPVAGATASCARSWRSTAALVLDVAQAVLGECCGAVAVVGAHYLDAELDLAGFGSPQRRCDCR
jgi:hypothetical protein